MQLRSPIRRKSSSTVPVATRLPHRAALQLRDGLIVILLMVKVVLLVVLFVLVYFFSAGGASPANTSDLALLAASIIGDGFGASEGSAPAPLMASAFSSAQWWQGWRDLNGIRWLDWHERNGTHRPPSCQLHRHHRPSQSCHRSARCRLRSPRRRRR